MKVFLQETIIKEFAVHSAKTDRQPAATPESRGSCAGCHK